LEKAATAKNPQPLNNKWIVITRPKHQAKALQLTLEQIFLAYYGKGEGDSDV